MTKTTLALAAALSASAGCACSEIYKFPVDITIESTAGAPFVPGAYELVIKTEEGTDRLECTLPSEGECQSSYREGAPSLTLAAGGGSVEMRRPYRSIELELRRDTQLLGVQSWTPTYRVDEYNGKGCGEYLVADPVAPFVLPAE